MHSCGGGLPLWPVGAVDEALRELFEALLVDLVKAVEVDGVQVEHSDQRLRWFHAIPKKGVSVSGHGLGQERRRFDRRTPFALTIGTTISELVLLEHAMWPGNSCTLGTICVHSSDAAPVAARPSGVKNGAVGEREARAQRTTVARRLADAPQTPLPGGMMTHATSPWNGPRMSSSSWLFLV